MGFSAASESGLNGFTKYRSLADASGNPVFNIPGMVLINPTSIAYDGTSASIGANGQVTFTAVTSLSLNGVFTADFDNYVIACRLNSSTFNNLAAKLRVAGSDDSTANSYVRQSLYADSTTVAAARTTTTFWDTFAYSVAAQRDGFYSSIYGPYLAQPTAFRTDIASGYNDAFLAAYAGTHNQSTSYDGISLIPNTGSMTGALQVYGVRS